MSNPLATVDSKPSDVGHTPPLHPWDEHNRKLYGNVHPPDWANPKPAPRYNLVGIGGGTACLVTAAGAAGLGAKVALVKKHLLGGDCLNVGCVPSKALIRAARAAAAVRQASEFGVTISPLSRSSATLSASDGERDGVRGTIAVDFGGVMERMRRLRVDISPHDSASRFRELGVDVFIGQGSFDMTDKTRGRGRPRPIPERARPTRPTGPTAAETFTACHSADES